MLIEMGLISYISESDFNRQKKKFKNPIQWALIRFSGNFLMIQWALIFLIYQQPHENQWALILVNEHCFQWKVFINHYIWYSFRNNVHMYTYSFYEQSYSFLIQCSSAYWIGSEFFWIRIGFQLGKKKVEKPNSISTWALN